MRWRNSTIDSSQFDALTRTLMASGSRRTLLGLLATLGVGVADAVAKKKKKKKKKKGTSQCYGYTNPTVCGPYCCDNYEPCCDYALDTTGKRCYGTTFQCCPAELGGGACALNETCCPALKGGLVATCANTALGDHCCATDSGGSCPATEDCCPSSTTNSVNQGCCRSGRGCCNVDTDCNTAAGEVCGQYDGCCGGF